MISFARRTRLAISLVVIVAAGITLLQTGVYGWVLFVILPFALGLVAACLARPTTASRAAAVGLYAALGACLTVFAFGLEGFVCSAMAVPLVVPLACLGALAAFWLQGSNNTARSSAVMMIVPALGLTWDVKAPPPQFQVTTQIVVHAPPAQVWKHVVSFPRVAPAREWVFHTGLAYPTEARIDGHGPGSVRYCQFSTGSFVEPVTVWDEPHLLRFRVTRNPPPLEEWSLWGEIRPRHLHGYLVSEQGQFELTPFGDGSTILTGTTWYRHNLWPAQYWRWWSDAVIHRIHLRVLDHVRTLAEQDARP